MAFAQDIGAIAQLASEPQALPELLRRALASLREIIAYDLAAVYQLDGETLRVCAAEGPLVDDRIRRHTLDLARFPTVRRALETRRPLALDAHHHDSEEGDPYDGILDLASGHACMVVPLFAADRSLGLMTFDRSSCGRYPPQTVELAGIYGQIISMAIAFAEQARLIDRYRHQLKEQNRLLSAEIGDSARAGVWLERSGTPGMIELVRLAKLVARGDTPVLLQGETGTGKEVLAKAIHGWSGRIDEAFVKLNCAALPENLVESELFGHVRGAFSGATSDRPGRFRTADRGTLLLDEIGDMPLAVQSKLLRVLQEGTFEPVGSDRTVRVDVRVVVASHVDLKQAVAAGTFREDLYYRLAVFPLTVPPLRDRIDDALRIAEETLGEERSLSAGAREAIRAARWPGNVRQLINCVERAKILRPAGPVSADDLGLEAPRAGSRRPKDEDFPTFRDQERAFLARALARTEGKVSGPDGAAALLGLKPTTLHSKLRKHGLR